MSLWLFTPLFLCINVWCIDSAYVDVSISKPCMCCIAKQLLATLIFHPYAIWKRGLDKEMCQRETKANLRKRWLNYWREWVTLIVGSHQSWLKASTMPLQVVIRNLWKRWHNSFLLAPETNPYSWLWRFLSCQQIPVKCLANFPELPWGRTTKKTRLTLFSVNVCKILAVV